MNQGRTVMGGLLWPLCGKNRYTQRQPMHSEKWHANEFSHFLSCGGLGGVKPAGLMGWCWEDIEVHWSVLLTAEAWEGFILINFDLNEMTLFRGVWTYNRQRRALSLMVRFTIIVGVWGRELFPWFTTSTLTGSHSVKSTGLSFAAPQKLFSVIKLDLWMSASAFFEAPTIRTVKVRWCFGIPRNNRKC